MKRTQRRTILVLSLVLCLSPSLSSMGVSGYFRSWVRYLIGDASSVYDCHIKDVSERYGLDECLVKALIEAESRFDNVAVSSKGAMGLMQLMPGTARDMGVLNPFDPRENIEGGVRYLKYLLKKFDNDVTLALAAYNAGPEVVKRYGGVPPYEETRAYLERVMKSYSYYRVLQNESHSSFN